MNSKAFASAALAALVLFAGCSGDDDQATPTPTDEMAPPTPTAGPGSQAPVNAAVQRALEVEGTYSGQWNNATFGSSGPIDLTIEVSAEAQFAVVALDLGGTVFGGDDPAPVTFQIDLATEDWLGGGDELFGQSDLTVDDAGNFVLTAPSVPGVGNVAMTMNGTRVATGYEGTYEITGVASGTFTLTAT